MPSYVCPLPDAGGGFVVVEGFSTALNHTDAFAATVAAKTQEKLEEFGNDVGSDHRDALRDVAQVFARSVIGGERQRVAVSLDTGLGKTVGLQVLLWTAHKWRADWPVLLFVPNLSAMEQMRDGLLNLGYPEELIALHFNEKSLKGEALRQTPRVKWASCPILIACHARATETEKSLPDMLQWKDGQRIVIHDEAVKKGDIFAHALWELESQLPPLKDFLSPQGQGWLEEVRDKLKVASPGLLSIPLLDDSVKADIERAINLAKKARRKVGTYEAVEGLLYGVSNVRIDRDGYFSFIKTFPDTPALFVLDASFRHSVLAKFDGSIAEASIKKAVKRYDKVVLTERKGGLGRTSVDDAAIEWAISLASAAKAKGDTPLIICFKDHEEKLRGKTGCHLVTWGMHSGSNSYKECNVVICVGVLRLRDIHGKALIALHKEELDADVSRFAAVVTNDQALHLYQGTSRSAARLVTTEPGKAHLPAQAKACLVYLSGELEEEQREQLRVAMPGLRFVSKSGIDELDFAEKVRDLLRHGRLASKNLKRDLPYDLTDRREWERLINGVEGVQKEGRSYRLTAEDKGKTL